MATDQTALVHKTAFAVAETVYIIGTTNMLGRNPRIVDAILERPLEPVNILLVTALIAVGVLLWPWTGRLARFVTGREPAPKDNE
jgi:hypothetical protein